MTHKEHTGQNFADRGFYRNYFTSLVDMQVLIVNHLFYAKGGFRTLVLRLEYFAMVKLISFVLGFMFSLSVSAFASDAEIAAKFSG